jgi:hypothetical protein
VGGNDPRAELTIHPPSSAELHNFSTTTHAPSENSATKQRLGCTHGCECNYDSEEHVASIFRAELIWFFLPLSLKACIVSRDAAGTSETSVTTHKTAMVSKPILANAKLPYLVESIPEC